MGRAGNGACVAAKRSESGARARKISKATESRAVPRASPGSYCRKYQFFLWGREGSGTCGSSAAVKKGHAEAWYARER